MYMYILYIIYMYILYIYTYYCREIERCVHMYLHYITLHYITLHCITSHYITLQICVYTGVSENRLHPWKHWFICIFPYITIFIKMPSWAYTPSWAYQDLATDRDLSWLSPSRPDQRIISARAHLRFVRTDVQKEAGVKCWRMSNSRICDKSGAAVKIISGLYNSGWRGYIQTYGGFCHSYTHWWPQLRFQNQPRVWPLNPKSLRIREIVQKQFTFRCESIFSCMANRLWPKPHQFR